MYIRLFLLVVLIIESTSCLSVDNSVYIISNNNQKDFLEQYFKINNVKYNFDKNYIILIKDDILVSKLLDLLSLLKKRININLENIENIKTTRTTDGSYYKRKYLELEENGRLTIKEDLNNNPLLVWDPTNPDSIKTGLQKGYVQYPNINIKIEYDEYVENINLYNSIIEYLKYNNVNIICDKLKSSDLINIMILKKLDKIIILQKILLKNIIFDSKLNIK